MSYTDFMNDFDRWAITAGRLFIIINFSAVLNTENKSLEYENMKYIKGE